LKCVRSPEEPLTKVCLVAKNFHDVRRLPLLAVKVSTGKVTEHGPERYLYGEWKEGWSDWLRQAKEAFPSVLEHSVFTFFIDGCSRVCSHQFVRHRLLSITQESQRYTEARILKAFAEVTGELMSTEQIAEALEPSVYYVSHLHPDVRAALELLFVIPRSVKSEHALISLARSLRDYLVCCSSAPMEDCRFLLPQAIRTSLLVTANLREWLHVIELRDSPKAQWEVRGVARAIKEILKEEVHEVWA